MMTQSALPIDCPRCRKALYPISTLRPRLGYSLLAKTGIAFAAMTALAIYWGLYAIVRSKLDVDVPARAYGFLSIPALVAGIAVAVPFNLLPRVVRYRCQSCGWWERFSIGRIMKPVSAVSKVPHAPFKELVERIETRKTHAGESTYVPSFDIVDDGGKMLDVMFWASLQFSRGVPAVEIHRQLLAAGWSEPAADSIVTKRCKTKVRFWERWWNV